jgi:hypothetical protein
VSAPETVRRIERLIALVAPALDLVLAVGDRVSRIAAPPDHEQRPVRPAGEPVLIEPPPGPRAGATDGGHA